MRKNTEVQQVQARRAPKLRFTRAEIFTIGPRKAVMEHLEARAAINPNIARIKSALLRVR